jgi:hypothetical protein
VFNHRNSPASRRIWRSRAFLPQIVPITLGRMRLELVSLTRRSRLSQRSSRKFVSFLSLFIEEAVVRHRMCSFRRKADFESGFYSSVMVKFQQRYQKTVRQEGRKAFFRLVLFGADEGSELQSQNSVAASSGSR